MSAIVVAGDTSGSVTLQAPAVSGTTVITLPSTSGTMALSGGAGSFTTLSASGESTLTGNVGIGNSSMGSFNTSYNNLVVGTGSGNEGLTIYAGSANSAYIGLKSAANTSFQGGWEYDFATNDLYTYINGTMHMRINSTGQLLLGNATAFYDTPVNVKGNNGYFAEVVQTSGGAYQANYTAGSGTCYYGYWQRAGALVGSISSSGSTTAYNTSSDYRLKENIQPMVGALDKILLLKPVTYTWKLDNSAGEGFIAHELQEVFPQAVTGEKDAVNEDGGIEPQGIDTSFLVATLTAAIQEQQALIENLTTRLSALENK